MPQKEYTMFSEYFKNAKAGSMKGKKKKPSRSNRWGMCTIAAIVAVMIVGLLVQSNSLRIKNEQYEEQKAELEQQIQDEEVRAEEIQVLGEYVNSDEYIEKLAREKLGLVYKDEVVYRPSSD